MAELQPVTDSIQSTISMSVSTSVPPRAVPQIAGAGPLWRSLLFPCKGQRAVEFGGNGSSLFVSLKHAGVQIEPGQPPDGTAVGDSFDLVLEDRTNGNRPVRTERVQSLLARGGRWVVAVERKRWIGLARHRVMRRLRRGGFDAIETFYAYPSLRSPRMLVPLDRPGPFQYFVCLATGVSGPRQRLLALGARCLCAMRLHHLFLTNLIVVARRTR